MEKKGTRFKHPWVLAISLLAVFFAMLSSCSTVQKLSAASIIKNTQLNIGEIAPDSVTIYTEMFPKGKGLIPDPKVIKFVENLTKGIIEEEVGRIYLTISIDAKNNHTDTLWLKDLKSVLKFDSLVTLPVNLSEPIQIAPGDNKFHVQTIMPIDGSLFHLSEVDTLHFIGKLDVSLKEKGETIPLEFSMDRFVTPEEKKTLSDRARKYVMDTILGTVVRFKI